MNTKLIFAGMLVTAASLYFIPKNRVAESLRNYKNIVINCTLKVMNEPSEDVKRLADLDDPAIGKVMDGEIFECVDKQMEIFYEQRT